MLDIQAFIDHRYPGFSQRKPLLAKPLIAALRTLCHEREFQQFGRDYPHLAGFDFVEQVLRYFRFSYSLRDDERERIPVRGRVVIIANHPIGSLDGLALLKLVREIRPDVKAVANELLMNIEPLHSVLLPVDNMGGNTPRENLRNIRRHLQEEGALIIFPAGEVSRMSPTGIRDGRWNSGFLRIAEATRSPILPVHIDGRNSWFFYSLSIVSRPLSSLWLVREMFKQAKNSMAVRIGQPIGHEQYSGLRLPPRSQVKLFRRHLYRIGKGKTPLFAGLQPIAHPEDRTALRRELAECELLGETADGKQIYLYKYRPDSALLREIGRLREIAFRAVGEGSGEHRDVDRYDQHYFQLVLWDEQDLEIVGAYRLCDTRAALADGGEEAIYSHSLFEYRDSMRPYLDEGLELGRSFVQPRYWGRRSLDYLWYGIGAFLRANPQYRYLFGPVSISDSYPAAAKDLLVHFYELYFGSEGDRPAVARDPYRIDEARREQLDALFAGDDYAEDFSRLKAQLAHLGHAVPTLYKQYTEVCEADGVQFSDFNVDPQFANCVDGFVMVDTTRLVAKKRARYMGC